MLDTLESTLMALPTPTDLIDPNVANFDLLSKVLTTK